MKRTIQGMTMAAVVMLAIGATPAMADGPGPPPNWPPKLADGPGPPPNWPPKAQVSAPVVNPVSASLIYLQ
jgi:hypothetical protein